MNFHINNIITILLSIYNIVKELVCISFYNEEAYEKSLMELFQNLGYNAFYGPDIERDYKNPLYMNDYIVFYEFCHCFFMMHSKKGYKKYRQHLWAEIVHKVHKHTYYAVIAVLIR